MNEIIERENTFNSEEGDEQDNDGHKIVVNGNINNLFDDNPINKLGPIGHNNSSIFKNNSANKNNVIEQKILGKLSGSKKTEVSQRSSLLNIDSVQPDLNMLSFGDANMFFESSSLFKKRQSELYSNITEFSGNKSKISSGTSLELKKSNLNKAKFESLTVLSNFNNQNFQNIENTPKRNSKSAFKFHKLNKFFPEIGGSELQDKFFDSNSKVNRSTKMVSMSFNPPVDEELPNKVDISQAKNKINYSSVPSGLFMTTEGMEEENTIKINLSNTKVKRSQNTASTKNDSKTYFNPFTQLKVKRSGTDLSESTSIKNDYIEASTLMRISEITSGRALIVSENNIIFYLPVFLLPKGAKIGEYFELKIKAVEN